MLNFALPEPRHWMCTNGRFRHYKFIKHHMTNCTFWLALHVTRTDTLTQTPKVNLT